MCSVHKIPLRQTLTNSEENGWTRLGPVNILCSDLCSQFIGMVSILLNPKSTTNFHRHLEHNSPVFTSWAVRVTRLLCIAAPTNNSIQNRKNRLPVLQGHSVKYQQ